MEKTSPKSNPKILVIDDNQDDLRLIKDFLTPRGYEVHELNAAQEVMAKVRQLSPKIVILDWVFPGKEGVNICREIKHTYPEILVFMLTVHKDTEYKVKAFNAGCDDYLTKPCELEELEIRIENLLRRGAEQSAQILKHGDVALDRTAHRVTKNGKVVDLTVKEYTLLEFFMMNPNKIVTRNMILNHIWGENTETFTNIVDVYINYLRKKLDSALQPSIIKTVRGAGYMMEEKAKVQHEEVLEKAA